MANMLYNGVELPDINTVWTDKATYPYASVQYYEAENVYRLAFSKTPAIHTTSDVHFDGETHIYALSGNTWVFKMKWTGVGFGTSVIWANHDVLNSDGSVYLAASEPVPVGGSHITTSSGNGFALYNGVKLPNIDSVWTDKETYLYAFVTYTVLSADVAMYDVRFATTEYGYNGSRFYPVNNGTYVSFTTPANQATVDWINANGGNVSLGVWRESGSGSLVASRAIKLDMRWHSFDIEGFGDATFPIPLDGMTVIEWDGVTDGNSIEIQTGYSIQRIGDYLPTDIYGGFVTSNTVADSNPITIYGSPSGSYSSIPDSYTAEASIFENDSWLVSYRGDELDLSFNALLSVNGSLPMSESITISDGLWVPVIGVNGNIAVYTPLVAYRSNDTPSEPTYDRTAFLSGMAMGLTGKGYPAGANGHMSYNGIELADINSIWTDKSNHVFICKAVNSYFAIVSTVAPYQDSVNGGVSLKAPFYFRQYGCFTDEATANEYGTTAYTWTFYQEHSLDEGVSNFDQTVIWTSTDIRKDSDGSVFLAASKPFPAGGMTVIGGGASGGGANGDGFALYNGVKLPNIDSVVSNTSMSVISDVDITDFEVNGHIYYLADLDTLTGYICVTSQEIVDLLAEGGLTVGLYTWTVDTVFEQGSTIWVGEAWNDVGDYTGFYSDPIPLDGYTVIEWDGNTEGLESVHGMYYKISPDVPPVSAGDTVVVVVDGNTPKLPIYGIDTTVSEGGYTISTLGKDVAVAFWGSDEFGTGLFFYNESLGVTYGRTTLFAYPALGGTTSDSFVKGYLVGAELRRKRVIPA